MDFSIYAEIASTLFQHAEFIDLRGWGESTIIPNFIDYLDIACKTAKKVKLISNGTTDRDDVWRELGRRGVIVGLSVDVADAETFKVLRGGGDLKTVTRNIERYNAGAAEVGFYSVGQLYFVVTVSSENIYSLEDVIKYGHSHGVFLFKFHAITLPEPDSRLLNNVDPFIITKVIGQLTSLASRLGVILEFATALHPKLSDRAKTEKLCIHPWHYLYIDAETNLGFCDHLNGVREYSRGTWSEGFQSFLNGSFMSELRRQHLRRIDCGHQIEICKECNWCYEQRYIDFEELIDPEQANYKVIHKPRQ